MRPTPAPWNGIRVYEWPSEGAQQQTVTVQAYFRAAMLHSLFTRTLGRFIVERRKELGLSGREVVAEVRNSDGNPISIPFLVDLEHDRRKPSDEVLEQFAKVLKVDSDMLYFLAGRFPADLSEETINTPEELAAAWKAFRREVKRKKKP